MGIWEDSGDLQRRMQLIYLNGDLGRQWRPAATHATHIPQWGFGKTVETCSDACNSYTSMGIWEDSGDLQRRMQLISSNGCLGRQWRPAATHATHIQQWVFGKTVETCSDACNSYPAMGVWEDSGDLQR